MVADDHFCSRGLTMYCMQSYCYSTASPFFETCLPGPVSDRPCAIRGGAAARAWLREVALHSARMSCSFGEIHSNYVWPLRSTTDLCTTQVQGRLAVPDMLTRH